MSMNWSVPYAAQGRASRFWLGLAAAARRWWSNYSRWRIEQLAIAQLHAMSDYELKDIGLKRSEIDNAVRMDTVHARIDFRDRAAKTNQPVRRG